MADIENPELAAALAMSMADFAGGSAAAPATSEAPPASTPAPATATPQVCGQLLTSEFAFSLKAAAT